MNALHKGGAYIGADEETAQTQFGLMLAEHAVKQVVADERANRIREIGNEQARLLGWRVKQRRARRINRYQLCALAALAFVIVAGAIEVLL